MEPSGAGRQSDGMLGSHKTADLALELLDVGAERRHPPRPDRVDDERLLEGADIGRGEVDAVAHAVADVGVVRAGGRVIGGCVAVTARIHFLYADAGNSGFPPLG